MGQPSAFGVSQGLLNGTDRGITQSVVLLAQPQNVLSDPFIGSNDASDRRAITFLLSRDSAHALSGHKSIHDPRGLRCRNILSRLFGGVWLRLAGFRRFRFLRLIRRKLGFCRTLNLWQFGVHLSCSAKRIITPSQRAICLSVPRQHLRSSLNFPMVEAPVSTSPLTLSISASIPNPL